MCGFVPIFYSLTTPTATLQILRYHIHNKELQKEHIAQADFHFSEERARVMELSARRMRTRESTISNALSDDD